ncbi:pilus assembly PilX family protein [Thiohalorhabdus denitrificans]|uniref:MSHA biogenesis protein MshP n=1 Tax=Thiohalorhabdus denitrificans TaxID=381306 RepID=A0A1G5B4M3_9GAMM|nr:hypothetical protein [Thiohalorhabdus denitrificans]SCX84990.1 hypothetical protein SAMN05661077_0669 [Thiohalorhabdus denitrificans]
MRPDCRNERGVGLIAAIFVIVVLAMLGTALLRLVTTEQRAVSREMASIQALHAAESAGQWGLYQALARGRSDLGPEGDLLAGAAGGLSPCGPTRIGGNDPNGLERFGTVTAPGGEVALFRMEVVGECHPGDADMLTRRRLEVRFQE